MKKKLFEGSLFTVGASLWWGILGVALQRAVANVVLYPAAADLMPTLQEPDLCLADLAAV